MDGWSLADLRSFPDRLLGWLADLLRDVERPEEWPSRLAEGYTALIPKEGPAGPLNTGLLTVVSMVYLLTVGGGAPGGRHCVARGLGPAGGLWFPRGQERPGRGGGDIDPLGAVSPPGWAVAGMIIHCVKCLDLIPEAVVLALVLGLGMDPGTCHALRAMYKQLRRAFKIARAFGLWWQAENGIVQGCLVSVILVNVLTTIWKWEVDSLRCQVCAQTAVLPPALEEDAAGNLEPGALLPVKERGPGYAAQGPSGYEDDTQPVALRAAVLRDTVPATEEWLRITGQEVRVDKSCS